MASSAAWSACASGAESNVEAHQVPETIKQKCPHCLAVGLTDPALGPPAASRTRPVENALAEHPPQFSRAAWPDSTEGRPLPHSQQQQLWQHKRQQPQKRAGSCTAVNTARRACATQASCRATATTAAAAPPAASNGHAAGALLGSQNSPRSVAAAPSRLWCDLEARASQEQHSIECSLHGRAAWDSSPAEGSIAEPSGWNNDFGGAGTSVLLAAPDPLPRHVVARRARSCAWDVDLYYPPVSPPPVDPQKCSQQPAAVGCHEFMAPGSADVQMVMFFRTA